MQVNVFGGGQLTWSSRRLGIETQTLILEGINCTFVVIFVNVLAKTKKFSWLAHIKKLYAVVVTIAIVTTTAYNIVQPLVSQHQKIYFNLQSVTHRIFVPTLCVSKVAIRSDC